MGPDRVSEDVFAVLVRFIEQLDDRDISDAARRWAAEELLVTAMPETSGAREAELATAFEAGRIYERLLIDAAQRAAARAGKE